MNRVRVVRRTIGYVSAGARTGVVALALLLFGGFSPSSQMVWAGSERLRAGLLLGIPMRQLRTESYPVLQRSRLWLAVQAVTGFPIALVVWFMILVVVAGTLTPLLWWMMPEGESFAFFFQVTSWKRALTLPPLLAAAHFAVLRWWVPPLARAHARLCRAVLAPNIQEALGARLKVLAASRAEALDAHAAELRRIERDLHDGVQARMVAIVIQLGVAQRQRAAAPHLADELIEKARSGIEIALEELRSVARSVYPPILADRGLNGALHALVADCPVPVRLTIWTLARLPAAVEAAAYFVIAEALANIAKHSGATSGTVGLDATGDSLLLSITDNGSGGAHEGRGTGLIGIRRRVAALDGRMVLNSPVGGPTTLQAELPCVW
jgi:signal transduction histidine kinase